VKAVDDEIKPSNLAILKAERGRSGFSPETSQSI
jgi:hypothetical protein